MKHTLTALFILIVPLACKEKSSCLEGTVVSIAGNHGHATNIPLKHVQAAVGGHYPMEGTADHDHVLKLKDADMQLLKKGEPARTITSSVESHVHDIEVRCK